MKRSTKKQFNKARNSVVLSNIFQTIMLSAPTMWLFVSFFDDEFKSKQPLFGVLSIICTVYITCIWIGTIDGLKLLKAHL